MGNTRPAPRLNLPVDNQQAFIEVASTDHSIGNRSDGTARPAPLSLCAALFVFLVHIPLAITLQRYPGVAAYIAGAEVLWRMTEVPVFWEFCKYAVSLVFLVAIQRTRPLKATSSPVLFFALLMPSIVLTISDCGYDFERFRRPLSFNLSGPLALAVCLAFFSRVRLTVAHVQRIVVAFFGPIVGILVICLFSITTAENLAFTTSSNFQTSGGFGPVQVSTVFGFAALLALLMVTTLHASEHAGMKWLFLGLMIWAVVQSAMTFSRSGIYLAAGSTAAAAIFGLRDTRARVATLAVVSLLWAVGEYLVVPRLDALTGGKISERFADTSTSGRDRLLQTDLDLWVQNPVFGLGPGMAKRYRGASSHTEFTRMAAEHGIFGVGACGMLLLFAWQALRQVESARWKGFVASMLAYTMLYLLSQGVRLVLPSLAFGLAFASYEE